MTFIHTEIILKLHDKKEQDLEMIQNAYIRYIRGQFKIKVDEVNDVPDSDQEQDEEGTGNMSKDLNEIVCQCLMKQSIDDFGFSQYHYYH